ncbi:hypothetical protein, partial [Clostridioides difficile]|uniref:hypothetical protein n=1 Tax=Clostridioides difficile TaxID=1496 RepID=UPI002ED0463B
MKELIKNDIIVVTTGCGASAAAKFGLMESVAPDFNSGISTFDLSLFLKFKIASLTIALASSSACSSLNSI